MKFFLLILLNLLICSSIISQTPVRCSTMEADAQLRQKYPQLGTLDDFENWLAPKVKEYKQKLKDGNPEQVYNIPVVVHIIHNSSEPIGFGRNISNAQAVSQIDVLNEDFRLQNSNFSSTPSVFQSVAADCEINFCLASVDPQGNTMNEQGINRIDATTLANVGNTASGYSDATIATYIKPATVWDPDKYMNIWVMQLPAGDLGFAQFPIQSGLPGLNLGQATTANTDGVVISYSAFGRVGNVSSPYDEGRTCTHEVGHWLGLRHIWGDATCGDDYCSDTPAQNTSNGGCPSHPSPSCSNSGDMFMNHMDYSNDACLSMFTQDQKARMMAVMQNSPRRGILNSSTVCSGQLVCDFDTHIGDFDTPTIYPDDQGSPAWGYIAGHNSFGDIAKCEKFIYNNGNQVQLRGAELYFSKAVDVSSSGVIDVVVWASDQSFGGGIPQNIITYETVPISSLNTGMQATYVAFSNPPTINSGEYYFVGIGLSYGTPQDTVALYTNADGEGTSTVYSYELWSDFNWYSMQSSSSWNKQINFAISPELCYQAVSVEESIEIEESLEIYPNPSLGQFNIEFDKSGNIEIYNLLGEIIFSQNYQTDRLVTIDISNQPKGVYILNFITNKRVISKRIVIGN